MNIEDYLGQPYELLALDEPFCKWDVSKEHHPDLDKPVTHYLYREHGLELRCDDQGKISAIFISKDQCNYTDESSSAPPFYFGKQQVRRRFGDPTRSGVETDDPVLGQCGAWDRFEQEGYSLHIEYRTDADSINKVTLIRGDNVRDKGTR